MSMILENILNFHKNRIEDIKKLKGYDKRIAIGSLIHDVGGRCLNKISKLFNVSWLIVKSVILNIQDLGFLNLKIVVVKS